MAIVSLFVAALAAPQGGVPTGPQLVTRVDKAYRAVKTLDQNVSGSIGGSKGTAHISYSRPGKMRVSGKTLLGAPYDVLWVGNKAWLKTTSEWTTAESLEMAIASISGISASAGTHVPAALEGLKWGSLRQFVQGSSKVSRAKVGGKDTFLLATNRGFPMKVWVDSKSSFFVRLESKVMDRTIRVDFDTPKVNGAIPAGRFTK